MILKQNTKIFRQKILGLLHFRSYHKCMSNVNMVTEIHLKLLVERVLSTGKPCTSEYPTLLQSVYRSRLSIHLYITQTF